MAEVSMNGISFTIVGDTRNAIRAIKNLKSSLRDLNSDLQTVGDRTERTSSRLKSAMKVLSKAGGAVVKPFKSGVTAVLTKATSRVNAFAKGVKKLTGGIGRIAMYRAFRAIIRMITDAFREGTKNLYAWSSAFGGTFAKNMDDAATSMLYFKNSIGAAWSPLMNVLAPALRTVTDAAVELLNVINQLLARLTGQSSWTRAIRKATEYGDAVGGAGAAAKEAMRYLAPFDELNVLPSDKGSGGGGGSATDTSGMFEEVLSFDTGIADFADKVKLAIENERWTALGVLLGNKVNDIVDSINWEGIGKKVGSSINALFTTKYWTLQTINFTNIGSSVATALNNAIGEINWEIVGRSVTQGITNVLDFVIGLVQTLNWSQVGTSVKNLLVGAFNQITDWAEGINWIQLGSDLVDDLKEFIEKLDLSEVATSFFKFLGTAIGAASAMIKGIASNIWTALKAYFSQYIEDENGNGQYDLGEKLEGWIKGGLAFLNNASSWGKTNIWDPFWKAVKDSYYTDGTASIKGGANFAEQFINGFTLTIKKAENYTPLTDEEIKEIQDRLYEPGEGIGKQFFEGLTSHFKNFKAWVEENIILPIEQAFNDFVANHPKIADWLGLEQLDIPEGGGGSASFGNETSGPGSHSTSSHSSIKVEVEAELTGFNDSIPTDKKKTLNWTIDANKFKDDIKTEDKLSKYWTANFTKRTVSTGVKAPVNVTAEMKRRIVAEGVKKPVNVSALMKKRTVGDAVKKPINVTADYKKRIVEEGVKKPVNVTAWMKKRELSDVVKQPISTTAAIGGVSVWVKNPDGSWSEIPDIRSKARLVDKYFAPGVSDEISMTGRITKIIKPGGAVETVMKNGGAYYGGAWHDIPQYASGGKPHGSMFIAGEAGAELVGHIGGRTEVLNQSQLAATMYSAVTSAMNGLSIKIPSIPTSGYDAEMDEDAMYRAMLRALNDSDAFPDEIDLDGDVVYRKMVSRNRLNTRMTGVNAMASVTA